MGMYICTDCEKKYSYLEMSNISHSAQCEICWKDRICTFNWQLNRFPDEGVTIEMQLDKLKDSHE